MRTHLEHLAAAVDATRIKLPNTCAWLGKPVPRLPRSLLRELPSQGARAQLVVDLQHHLYENFYCKGAVMHAGGVELARPGGDADFVAALAEANSGGGCIQAGWRVVRTGAGILEVQRGGVTMSVDYSELVLEPGQQAELGESVAVRFPKGSAALSPGFYIAFGDKELTSDGTPSLLRLYWNSMARGAPSLMRQITMLLNRARVPFRFKVLDDPDRFTRCDAAVLYLDSRDFETVAAHLESAYGNIAKYLKPDCPVFTKQLAPGLGLAEDPGAGSSFGLQRCELLADGLIAAAERGQISLESRLATVVEHFQRAGVDLQVPYLNPGSADVYVLRRTRAEPEPRHVHLDSFLDTATRIGRRLVDEAIWHRDRCTWIAPDPIPIAIRGYRPSITQRPLGADVYDGAAGVALFLAMLARETGDRSSRRTAVAAARQALFLLTNAPTADCHGLYTGSLGVAWAVERVGALVDQPELVDSALLATKTVLGSLPADREFDLISGDAGAIIALLALHNSFGEPFLEAEAIRIGEGLLQSAKRSDEGWCWASRSFLNQHPLLGFSHGTAGVAYAFVELFSATGDERFRAAAQQAFAYERSWFDGRAANWPDLRELRMLQPRPRRTLPAMVAWCHGAAGIALSRVRALRALNDESSRAEARIALKTTLQMTAATLQAEAADFSLCHGLAGNADILLLGSRALREGEDAAHQAARDVGEAGIRQYASRSWPCGGRAGETPGLMLGLAGIGTFYLRLHDSSVPSPLMPTPTARPPRGQPDSARPSSLTPPPQVPVPGLYAGPLEDEHVAAVVRLKLAAAGFTAPRDELDQAAAARWRLGCWLRDQVLADRLPAFASLGDYVALAEVEPSVWRSLPFQLAFGYQQAHALHELAQVPAELRESSAIVCAVFSALLSTFDYIVDETPHRATAFELEQQVLPEMFNQNFQMQSGAQAVLPAAYKRHRAPILRLLCSLFAVCDSGFHGLLRERQNVSAWQSLAELMTELFQAERIVTLATPHTANDLAALSSASQAKSVLPFVVLLQALVLATDASAPSPQAHSAATSIGRAIALVDDLVDIVTDCQRAAPSPLVSRLAQRSSGQDLRQASANDLYRLVENVVPEVLAELDPRTFGAPCDEFVNMDSDAGAGRMAALQFTQLTIARWVGFSDNDVAPSHTAAELMLDGRPTEASAAAVAMLIREDKVPVDAADPDCLDLEHLYERALVLEALLDARATGHVITHGALEQQALSVLCATSDNERLGHSINPDLVGMCSQVLRRAGGFALAAPCELAIPEAVAAANDLPVPGDPHTNPTSLTLVCSGPDAVGSLVWGLLVYDRWRYQADIAALSAGLERTQGPDGFWSSRWYATPHYSTYRALASLKHVLPATPARSRAAEALIHSQHFDGSWGTDGDPLSTALAVLSLATLDGEPRVTQSLQRGVQYLERTQAGDGGWTASALVGPASIEQPLYVNRVLTTALCLKALVATSLADNAVHWPRTAEAGRSKAFAASC